MIEVYKVLTGKYATDSHIKLVVNTNTQTRGNIYKLNQGQVRYDLRKYFSTNRIISVWNSLLDIGVMAHDVNAFKNRLDRWW